MRWNCSSPPGSKRLSSASPKDLGSIAAYDASMIHVTRTGIVVLVAAVRHAPNVLFPVGARGEMAMANIWEDLSPYQGFRNEPGSGRQALGAQERRRWSSYVRQDLIKSTIAELQSEGSYGTVVVGPGGVGKSMLGSGVARALAESTHVVRLYGNGLGSSVPYSLWGLYLAKMENPEADSPIAVIQGISKVITEEAAGRDILLIADDLINIDNSSMGVIMHLVFSRTTKLLILTRSSTALPEDLAWMLKDGRLSKVVLSNFTRGEVRTLITRALGGSVAVSTVSALHQSSGGNPLVLQALVHDELSRGRLVQQNSTWVLKGQRVSEPAQLLVELVESRLESESLEVRRGIEKMSLIQRAPLSLVMDILGADVVSELEQRNYIRISDKTRHYTSLAEAHIGETVRSLLSREEKARLFKEMTDLVSISPEKLSREELLVFMAWALDAGITIQPDMALAAGRAALLYFDPQLALRCTEAIPRATVLGVHAAMVRSCAYSILADYGMALAELKAAEGHAEKLLDATEHVQWVLALTEALLWTETGPEQVPGLLAHERERIVAAGLGRVPLERSLRLLDLAMFEYQVHCGMFAEAVDGLEKACNIQDEHEFRLNCASLLVTAWTVMGREVDAIALAGRIREDVKRHRIILRQPDLYLQGLILALTWTGQWKRAALVVNEILDSMQKAMEFRGGITELGLGLAYTYAGKGFEAAELLAVAAAQLEIRDTYNCRRLAYSAMAFAYAQVDSRDEANKYLELALREHPSTAWVNAAMSQFFSSMAQRWMDQPEASEKLLASAAIDAAAGRYTTASMSLFGATMNGRDKDFQILADVSSKRQGPMAELSVCLARACLTRNAELALAAARIAETLELRAVESRCAVVALELARDAGDGRRAREADARLVRLVKSLPVLPLTPQTGGVKLTQRELQIAKLASRRMGNRAIADRLGVSVRTVEGHLYQIFSKLGISSRNELP